MGGEISAKMLKEKNKMTKTERAERIIQELFEQQGIAELYNEIDDACLNNTIKTFTNNRITEQRFKEIAFDLVLGYKAIGGLK